MSNDKYAEQINKMGQLVKEGKIKKLNFFYTRSEETLQLLAESMHRLTCFFKEHFGYDLYLTYGTLIGSLRDNDFIPYDYDVDLSYLSSKTSKKEVVKEYNEIIAEFSRIKKLAANHCHGHFHCRTPNNRFTIDIWTSYALKDKYYMIPSIKGGISKDVVVPLKPRTFRGYSFYVPQNSEFLLDYMYVDWKTPILTDWRKFKWSEFLNH